MPVEVLLFGLVNHDEVQPVFKRLQCGSNRRLGVDLLFNGVGEKLPILEGLLAELGIPADEVAYMGDDVNDVDCLRAVGLSFAPSDAAREAKAAAWTVTSARGGEGAVREAAELVLMLNRTAEAP